MECLPLPSRKIKVLVRIPPLGCGILSPCFELAGIDVQRPGDNPLHAVPNLATEFVHELERPFTINRMLAEIDGLESDRCYGIPNDREYRD